MMQNGLKPDKFAFPFALKSCAGLSNLLVGKSIHQHLIQTGFDSDVLVATAVMDMYAKCGSLDLARKLFDQTQGKDVVCWSAMIASYGIPWPRNAGD
ncbi:hypothetical protein Patl1_06126 [Pistacia atlantica]|uniref:Uncharacterized protein n=1 Tax=Pistacia atlantica TaxID=434234 RepID=A0ACC1BSD4_9ROSI|nr:hypothetical protein Patl1_06126 [Pistacia atlantica]